MDFTTKKEKKNDKIRMRLKRSRIHIGVNLQSNLLFKARPSLEVTPVITTLQTPVQPPVPVVQIEHGLLSQT